MTAMKIQDISDRVYQGQVYALLDQAQSSIVISMYLLRPGEDPKHPVNRLLEDLLEARKRGVEVTIYMNTKFKKQEVPAEMFEGEWFKRLRKAGAQIRPVSPLRRLHDKLVIVDRRIVVEGSMNWSVTALADNFESATIIESPELAEAKLKRIGFFPIWGEDKPRARPPKRLPEFAPLFPQGPPASIEVPVGLVEERRYFPRMISKERDRSLKVFLLLLYLAQAAGRSKILFPPESAGLFLEILPGQDRSALRRQIIRVLRDLETLDGLSRAKFRFGKEAMVELLLPEGPAFTVGSEDLQPGELAGLDDNEIFVRLLRARLREEGKRLEDLSSAEIERRFFFNRKTYRQTLRRGRKPRPAPV